MGTGGFYPGVKLLGREADHFPPSLAEVKNLWSYTSTPQYDFMEWGLVKYRNNSNFYLLNMEHNSGGVTACNMANLRIGKEMGSCLFNDGLRTP
jgi:hypothetical protein